MSVIDHLFVFIVVVLHPVAGYLSYRKLIRQARAGKAINRCRIFEISILQQWTLFGVCLALWSGSKRSWDTLGFGLTMDTFFAAGAALAVATTVVLGLQYRQVATASREDLERYRKSIGSLDLIIPRNGNELGRFYLLSVTAGIVEETLWRGFLIWYLAAFMPVWVAAVVSSVAFGIAHAYQGPANIPKIMLVGGVFAAIYLLTGSLWLAMLMHAVVDIVQGRVAYELIRRTDHGAPPADESDDDPGATEPA
jgi:membrane protease YdiL (CAAX protease family)